MDIWWNLEGLDKLLVEHRRFGRYLIHLEVGAEEKRAWHQPRPSKIARPIRIDVAPSSIATRKSSLIPIERVSRLTVGCSRCNASRNLRSAEKIGRVSSESATRGAIVISPRGRNQDERARRSINSDADSGTQPAFCGSRAMLTWRRTEIGWSRRSASFSSASISEMRSTDSMISNNATAGFALLD